MRSGVIACVILFVVAAASGQQQTAAAHVGNAVRLMQESHYSEAALEFERALASDPNNDALRIQYATCLFAAERNDDARKQFESERQRLGSTPGIEYYLGLLDLRAEKYASAIGRLKPLEENPAFPRASFYLGQAYLSEGQPDAARASLERAARNNPHDPDVHYRLARVYSTTGRADDANREYAAYRSAREEQRIVEQEAPACMDALQKHETAKSREICQRLAGDSANATRLVLLGRLYSGAGDFDDAVPPLQRATALDPRLFEAWHFLGLSLYGLHRYQEAVAPLRKAAELNPQYFDTLSLLAKALYAQGDYPAALPVMERAHDLNPADTQLAAVLASLRTRLNAK